MRERIERQLLADRQAQLTGAIVLQADMSEVELIDVSAGLAEWEQWLAADPEREQARVAQLERELGVA